MPAEISERRAISSVQTSGSQLGKRAEGLVGVVGRRPVDAARITTMLKTFKSGESPVIASDGLIDVPHTTYGMHGSNGLRSDNAGLPIAGPIGLERPSRSIDAAPQTIDGIGTYIMEPAQTTESNLVAAQPAFDTVTHGTTTLEPRKLRVPQGTDIDKPSTHRNTLTDNIILYLPENTREGTLVQQQWEIVDPGKSLRDTLAGLRNNVPPLLRRGLHDVAPSPEIKDTASVLLKGATHTSKYADILKDKQIHNPLAEDTLIPDRNTPNTRMQEAIRVNAETTYDNERLIAYQQVAASDALITDLRKNGYQDFSLSRLSEMAQVIMEEVEAVEKGEVTVDPEGSYASFFSRYSEIIKTAHAGVSERQMIIETPQHKRVITPLDDDDPSRRELKKFIVQETQRAQVTGTPIDVDAIKRRREELLTPTTTAAVQVYPSTENSSL